MSWDDDEMIAAQINAMNELGMLYTPQPISDKLMRNPLNICVTEITSNEPFPESVYDAMRAKGWKIIKENI